MKRGQVGPIIVFLAILVFGLLAILIYNNSQTSTTGSVIIENKKPDVSEPKKNCREVQVPRQVTEEYIEQEPYQGFEDVQVDLKYEHNGYHRASYSDLFNVREKGIVNVKNVDSESGFFTVKMYFITLEDGTVNEQTGGYVQPSETKEFSIYYDIDSGEDVEWKYEVIAGQKTITKPVTKYRPVTKTKTVTKYVTETKCD